MLLSSATSLLLGELLCAIAAPHAFVQSDILGRKPVERSPGSFLRLVHDRAAYPDLVPGSSGFQRLAGNYDCRWTIDRLGLRSPELSAIPPGAFRILALGDSQTFGLGVAQNETFCARLQARLDAGGARRLAVLNAGVPSYGTFEEAWKLERIGAEVRPDLVLVVVNADNALVPDQGNDLYNNLERLAQGPGAAVKELDGPPTSDFLERHSHLYHRVRGLFRRLRREASYATAVAAYRHEPANAAKLARVWAATLTLLRGIEAEARRTSGARTVVVHLPGAASLEADDRSVASELRKSGLPVVSLFEALQAARQADTRRICFPNDGHYNAFAHARIALALERELRAGGFVPAASGRNPPSDDATR